VSKPAERRGRTERCGPFVVPRRARLNLMFRTVVALIAEVLLVVVVALLLGALWQWFLTGDLASGFVEGARLLFLFMDVGLAIWVVVLIILTVRGRVLPGIGVTLLVAAIAVALNAIVVLVVGFAQGGWAPLLVLFAITAGVAFLIAVLVVAPIIRSLARAGAGASSAIPRR
jgi:hypothetical protein